ncbi:MAG: aminodeoxychorismate/anthranilate synthase component II [Candidatus Margulisiibacteriota bacterium]
MLLVIDNYDSFTYNLVQYFAELGYDPLVFRNDQITLDEIEKIAPKYLVISPGPGRPENAGISESVVRNFCKKIPILGVCLGHQAIGQVFGAKITYAASLMHGKTSEISHDNKTIYLDLPQPFTATRYHSLVISKENLPVDLEISAMVDDVVMGIRHKQYPVEGIQFHPESILTKVGKQILNNFLTYYK